MLGNFVASDDQRGGLFEHLVFTQIYHRAQAEQRSIRVSNYRTEHQAELDFIVEFSNGETIAVECKAGRNVGKNDLKGFESFASFFKKQHRKLVIYGGTSAKQIDDVKILPFQMGIEEVFSA
jgi:hypothetical protein